MIKYIIIGLIAILVVSFLGYDLQSIVEAPGTQKNLHYVGDGVVSLWDKYLEYPITYFWNNIFIGILWNSFMHNLGKVNSGAPTELEAAAQRLWNIGDQPYQPIAE